MGSKIKTGSRVIGFLFPKAIEYAPFVDNEEELFQELKGAVTANCEDPNTILDSEIRGCAQWAWSKRLDSSLWGGQLSAAQIHHHEVTELLRHKNGPDALALLYELHHNHAAQKGKRFALATRAMAQAGFNGWSEWRIRSAKSVLLKVGLIRLVQKGGLNKGPSFYQIQRIPKLGVHREWTV